MNGWRFITKANFTKKIAEMGGMQVFPKVSNNTKFYQIKESNGSETVKFVAGRYEYEYNDIGVYRFRDLYCGPWTKWIAMN